MVGACIFALRLPLVQHQMTNESAMLELSNEIGIKFQKCICMGDIKSALYRHFLKAQLWLSLIGPQSQLG